MSQKIRFSNPEIKNNDIDLVSNIIKSGWLTHGKFTDEFENLFKKYTNSKYAITVSSCTAGLHLSCLAANFKKGDEIIVPNMTHTATAHAVEYTGAKAVLTDVDFKTGNIDLINIKKKYNKNTKGVIIVHMAGYPCNISEIKKFCDQKKITIIEDCAHALGSFYKNKHVGNFGISGCFSFYPTKQITTGEGGMVITNNKKIFNSIKKLKAFGIDKDIAQRKKQGLYDVKSLGFNYRMTDFQAALGLRQLKTYKENLNKRKSNAMLYKSYLSKFKSVQLMKHSTNCSYFVYQIFCKRRDELLKVFKLKKIGVSVHYSKPLHKMTYYKKKYNLFDRSFISSNKYSDRNISLPVYPKLKKKDIKKICGVIRNFFKNEK